MTTEQFDKDDSLKPMWGVSARADFPADSWTFTMRGEWAVSASAYAILHNDDWANIVSKLAWAEQAQERAVVAERELTESRLIRENLSQTMERMQRELDACRAVTALCCDKGKTAVPELRTINAGSPTATMDSAARDETVGPEAKAKAPCSGSPAPAAPTEGPTPRTDAKVFSVPIAGGNHACVFAEDARQLERELAEAKAELERVEQRAAYWERKFQRECELHDATTQRAMRAESALSTIGPLPKEHSASVDDVAAALAKLFGTEAPIVKELRELTEKAFTDNYCGPDTGSGKAFRDFIKPNMVLRLLEWIECGQIARIDLERRLALSASGPSSK